MSLLRRGAEVCLSSLSRTRGGVPWKGSFWSDGTQTKVDGYLFNETPPPPGQSRRLESWEIPYWGTFFLTAFVGTVLIYARADLGVHVWADREARKELKAEGLID